LKLSRAPAKAEAAAAAKLLWFVVVEGRGACFEVVEVATLESSPW